MKNIINVITGEVTQEEYTEQELVDIAATNIPATPLQALQRLDADNQLTQRNLRETIMLMNEAFKMVSNNAVDLSNIPGVAQVYAVEARAAALRAQL